MTIPSSPSTPNRRTEASRGDDFHLLTQTMAVIARSRELLDATRGVTARLHDGPRHRATIAAVDLWIADGV